LEVFIKESKLEHFYNPNSETIYVSTIHKAKGREFDNLFVLLDSYDYHKDENKRALYVAMTRAKRDLAIHYNKDCLNDPQYTRIAGLVRTENSQKYQPPTQIAIITTHKNFSRQKN